MSDLDAFVRKVNKLEKDLTDDAMLNAVGMKGKQIGTSAISSEIGDTSLSNWRRGKPVDMKSRFDIKGDSVVIGPNKRGRGPVRVLNEGRKAGTSRKGRPVSSSQGKGTWNRAQAEMERELPKTANQHAVKVIRKHFG
jgi:hypothetical protein